MRIYKAMAAALCVLLASCNSGGQSTNTPDDQTHWYASWGTANYTTFPNGPLSTASLSPNTAAFLNNEAVDQSFRMMIHPTVRGDRVRLLFSNVYGDRPLTLSNANIAQRSIILGAAIDNATLTPLTFSGKDAVTIPPGEEVFTDGVNFNHEVGDNLAVSFHIPGPSGPMSWHAEAFSLQYISLPDSGDVTRDSSGLSFLSVDRGWFFLSGMQSQQLSPSPSEASPFTIVAFGDSITDGFISTPELNHRWPDFLARRLQDAGISAGVVNAGINSNTVTPVRDPVTAGEPAITRFFRDVASRGSVRSVFVLLGTNDIVSGASAEEIYAGLLDLRDQAHEQGICIVVSTLLPRNDPPAPFGWSPLLHAPVREALNDMIRSSNDFDAVTDALAEAMENPLLDNQPNNLLFVEGLHPNTLGMKVLADAVPLETLLPPPVGICNR